VLGAAAAPDLFCSVLPLKLLRRLANRLANSLANRLANRLTTVLQPRAQPQYITIGDEFSDAYTPGERKVEQAATECKDPFANGMTPASRHRGKQFLTAPPKSSQTDREVGVNAKFATNSTGDPYEDQWKRQHKHYQRANKGSAAVGPGIRAGAAAASPQAAYLPTFGTTVAIPTRRVESYDSYVRASPCRVVARVRHLSRAACASRCRSRRASQRRRTCPGARRGRRGGGGGGRRWTPLRRSTTMRRRNGCGGRW